MQSGEHRRRLGSLSKSPAEGYRISARRLYSPAPDNGLRPTAVSAQMFLRITKLSEDADAPHVKLLVAHGDYSAAQDSYISDEEFLEFAQALQSFPRHLEHEVIFESGSTEPTYYCHTRLRAFVYDGVGHAALEVRFENHLEVPYSAAAHYHILCEAAALNRLGKLLESWAHSGEREFEYSTDAA